MFFHSAGFADGRTIRSIFMKLQLATQLLLTSVLVSTLGCEHHEASFSLLDSGQTFSQVPSSKVNNKIDILWVVDNSGSMNPLQTNLLNNFKSFITDFQTKGFDFKMAVTTSDAYRAAANFGNSPSLAQFSDGVASRSGFRVITQATPNLVNNFLINANQGDQGSGDERVFSSMKEALNSSLNSGFLRPGAFLSVIILSDEDDFSDSTRPEGSWAMPGGVPDHSYTNPSLETVDSYISYLDTMTGSTGANRKYNVSAITVLDSACQNTHAKVAPTSTIGLRYMEIAQKTRGTLGSVCDSSFANSLATISQNIIELSSQFVLNRVPVESTIVVSVNGATVVNAAINGWTYVAASNSILFHGTAVPPQGASIQVAFTPKTASN